MKRIIKILFSIFIISMYSIYPQNMLLTVVSNNVESLNIVDKSIRERRDYINIDGEIPQIVGLSDEKNQKKINDKIFSYSSNWIKENIDASETFKPTMPYELSATYSVTNKQDVLSFYIDYYQFNGGAHGIINRKSYNINIENGEELKLKDLFEYNFDYKDYINKFIIEEINRNKDAYFIGKDGFNGIEDNQGFFIRDKKLVIYFDYYKIAPYVAGMPEFEIPYEIK